MWSVLDALFDGLVCECGARLWRYVRDGDPDRDEHDEVIDHRRERHLRKQDRERQAARRRIAERERARKGPPGAAGP